MRRAYFLSVGLATAVVSCSFAPEPRDPAPVRAVPSEYAGSAEVAAETASLDAERWWTVFDDPVLEALVDTALAANLDLREAVARVEEVRQRHRIARADLLPALGVGADVGWSSAPSNTGFAGEIGGGEDDGDPSGPPVGPVFPDRFEYATWSAAANFSYELDFWGRARNDTKAAVSDFLASTEDFRTARIGVIAATISTYLEIVELRRAVDLTRLNVDLLGERAELTDRRYYRGLVSSFELYTIQAQYRNQQAALPLLEAALADAESRLAVLLGRYAGSIADLLGEAPAVAVVPDPVPPDLPAALLEERPDVRAAWLRMEASRYRTGARRAELFPSIRLSATAGFQAGDASDLFRADQWFVNLLGGLTQPLFQGGRLRASAGAAEARYVAAATAYARTVLTAHREVVSSLANLEKQVDRYEFLRAQKASAEGSVRFQVDSFERGVGDYLQYLDARRNLVNVETNLAATERALAEARLAVHRALGGAWVEGDDVDERLRRDYERLEEDLLGDTAGRPTDTDTEAGR
jgi:multidrug efflux system outer membrane protein